MTWRAQINDKGVITRFSNSDTGEVISAQEYERRMQMLQGGYTPGYYQQGYAQPGISTGAYVATPITSYPPPKYSGTYQTATQQSSRSAVPFPVPDDPAYRGTQIAPPAIQAPLAAPAPTSAPASAPALAPVASLPPSTSSPLIQPGAQILSNTPTVSPSTEVAASAPVSAPTPLSSPAANAGRPMLSPNAGASPTAGMPIQGKNLRLEGVPSHVFDTYPVSYKPHGFLDATSIAILLPTLILVALSIAAAHKKRLFPWQTIRTFSPPSGMMTPRDYEISYLCPPNLRRHGRMGKRNPNATWTEADGVVLPFGFLARTHLPVTIPLGRLPNKNMFIVAPSGSGKTTLMRAIIKALLAKPCVIIALEAKANDPNLDERKEGFKYTVLPEAKAAGFDTLYFNPLDSEESINWNPLDLSPIVFASSIVQDINSLAPEEQHWAERDHGYIAGLTQLLKWGAVQVAGENEDGYVSEVQALPCNPRGLMKLVNNRRNIVESLRRLKDNPEVDPAELSELTQTLSSIIRTDTDWDKNIQGVRGRLRMFKNPSILKATETSNVDLKASMHKPTVLIFGAPASLGPDAESLAACFVYQLQQALHTRYGTVSVLPLFAFFDEYQTLNLDTAGRLSAIVRGANGGLAVILQNVSQIASSATSSKDAGSSGASELRTIFSNSSIRVCLHNADETTARFFSDEIGKHAIIMPGLSDHFASGAGMFPSSWNRIHSQQVVARVDADAIKRMEKQHALVYLSPAGDPEFGEVKPFMVDLRGIEEIARLHLLHNVSARNNPPSGGEQLPMPAPPTHVPWQSNLGQSTPTVISTAGAAVPAISNAAINAPTTAVGKLADTLATEVSTTVTGTILDSVNSPLAPKPLPDNQSRHCPACKQIVTSKKFCTNCGASLNTPEPINIASIATKTPAAATKTSATTATTTAPQFPFAQTGQVNPSSSVNQVSNMSIADEITALVNNTPTTKRTQSFSAQQNQTIPVPKKPVTSLNAELNNTTSINQTEPSN